MSGESKRAAGGPRRSIRGTFRAGWRAFPSKRSTRSPPVGAARPKRATSPRRCARSAKPRPRRPGADAVVIRVAGKTGCSRPAASSRAPRRSPRSSPARAFRSRSSGPTGTRETSCPRRSAGRPAGRGRRTCCCCRSRCRGKPLGSLELLRSRRRSRRGRSSQLGSRPRTSASSSAPSSETNGAVRDGAPLARALSLAGDALAAGLDRARSGGRSRPHRGPRGRRGGRRPLVPGPGRSARAARLSRADRRSSLGRSGPSAPLPSTSRSGSSRRRTGRGRTMASFTLGQPAVGVLELAFPAGTSPSAADLDRIATFAIRAGQALRAGERAEEMSLELERSEALLAVVGQAIAELSLAHTLETAVARVSELLRSERVAVYLRQGTRLRTRGRDRASPAPSSRSPSGCSSWLSDLFERRECCMCPTPRPTFVSRPCGRPSPRSRSTRCSPCRSSPERS